MSGWNDSRVALQSVNFSRFLFTYYAYAGTFGTYATPFFAARGLTVAQIGVLVSPDSGNAHLWPQSVGLGR